MQNDYLPVYAGSGTSLRRQSGGKRVVSSRPGRDDGPLPPGTVYMVIPVLPGQPEPVPLSDQPLFSSGKRLPPRPSPSPSRTRPRLLARTSPLVASPAIISRSPYCWSCCEAAFASAPAGWTIMTPPPTTRAVDRGPASAYHSRRQLSSAQYPSMTPWFRPCPSCPRRARGYALVILG